MLDAVYQEVKLLLLGFCYWIKLVVLALHLYLLRLFAQLLVRCAELLVQLSDFLLKILYFVEKRDLEFHDFPNRLRLKYHNPAVLFL